MTPEKKRDIQWQILDNFYMMMPDNEKEIEPELVRLGEVLEETAGEYSLDMIKKLDKEFSFWLQDEGWRKQLEQGYFDMPNWL